MPSPYTASAKEYMPWQAGRWSRKRREEDGLDLARRYMGLDEESYERKAQKDDQRARSYRQFDDSITDVNEDTAYQRRQEEEKTKHGYRKEEDSHRSQVAREAHRSALEDEENIALKNEDRRRARLVSNRALKYSGQINPITQTPYSIAEAQAKAAMDVGESETAGMAQNLNAARRYAGAEPLMPELGAETTGAEIEEAKGRQAVGAMLQEDPSFSNQSVAAARERGEQERLAAAEKDKRAQEFLNRKPKGFFNSFFSGGAGTRQDVYDFSQDSASPAPIAPSPSGKATNRRRYYIEPEN